MLGHGGHASQLQPELPKTNKLVWKKLTTTFSDRAMGSTLTIISLPSTHSNQ